MLQDLVYKMLMAPVSLLYGLGVGLRNLLYQNGLLKSVNFDIPIISVGNLSVGGAGKTPHVEYLLIFLKKYIRVATLSRGYKRETGGFLIVEPHQTAKEVGDEPLQYKRKFRDVMVAVSEDRTFAVPRMLMADSRLQTILLDDAFQHRAIEPGLNILLTEFEKPFTRDFLLPSGRLREWRSSYARADIMVVSKCPDEVTENQRDEMIKELKPLPHQQIFFSYYKYTNPYYLFNGNQRIELDESWDVLLICGIARPDYLLNYLRSKANFVRTLEFADHHLFTKQEIGNLKGTFDKMESKKTVIITTEKDAVRLDLHSQYIQEQSLPIFVLPVKVAFHFEEEAVFQGVIKEFLLDFKV